MISIVGNGAIGNLLALRCEQLNHPYQLLVRNEAPDTLICLHQEQSLKIHPTFLSLEALNSLQGDLLILPLKSYQIVEAMNALKNKVPQSVCIVLLHNGMGPHESIQEIFPRNPVIIATTSYGAYKPVKGQLNVTGIGKTQAGWLSGQNTNKQAGAIFESLLPPCEWHDNITSVLWQKLAVNAVINPLTAINNIPNGDLSQIKFQHQIAQVCEEISMVMNALGMQTSKEQLIERSLNVAHVTALNYSSMHQDIYRRRKTEIDDINGYVVKQALSLGLPTPVNQALCQQIKKKEAS